MKSAELDTKYAKTINFLVANSFIMATVLASGLLPSGHALVYAGYVVIACLSLLSLLMVLLVSLTVVQVNSLKFSMSLLLIELSRRAEASGKISTVQTIKGAAQYHLNNLPDQWLTVLVHGGILYSMISLQLPYALQLMYLVMVIGNQTVGYKLRKNLKVIINE